MSNIVNRFDDNSAYKITSVEYPHILIEDTTEALAVLVSCLEDGDIPLYIEFNGTTHRLDKTISKSPLNLSKILKVYPMTIYVSKDELYKVTNTSELMDLGLWWER